MYWWRKYTNWQKQTKRYVGSYEACYQSLPTEYLTAILNFKMVAVNTKTGIFKNIFATGEPKLAHIHFTLYESIWNWYWPDTWPPSWTLKWPSWLSIIRHISEYIDDKSTKFGTHILCDIPFHIKLSTNYYRHGILPPSWIFLNGLSGNH